MKTIRKTCLRFTEGNSDKLYEVDLCELANTSDARYLVNFRYGRYGKSLREGSKTTQPTTLTDATKIFDSLVVSKINKGYVDTAQAQQTQSSASTPAETPISASLAAGSSELHQTILGYLDKPPSHWPLSRIVWRAGELKITEAADKLAQIAEKELPKKPSRRGTDDQVALQYSLMWALGRCGNEYHLPTLQSFYSNAHFDSVKYMARAASVAVLGSGLGSGLDSAFGADSSADATEHSVTDDILNNLNNEVADAIDNNNANAIVSYFVKALKTRRHNKLKPRLADLVSVYTLGMRYACCQQAVVRILQQKLLHEPHFQGLRNLFKLSEFRQDAPVFALLTQQIENLQSGWEYDHTPQSVNYLRKRSWRALRKLGQANSPDYVPLASAILLGISDADAIEPNTVQRTAWNWNTYTKEVVSETHYDRFPKQLAFNQILFKHSDQFTCNRSGLMWHRISEQADTHRTEAFAELWDNAPDALLTLLTDSQCQEVHTFASKALAENLAYCTGLGVDMLGLLMRSAYDVTAAFALSQAKLRYEQTQDTALISACMSASYAPAKTQAMQWITQNPACLKEDLQLFAIVLCHAGENDKLQAQLDTLCDSTQLSDREQRKLLQAVIQHLKTLADSDIDRLASLGNATDNQNESESDPQTQNSISSHTIHHDHIRKLIGASSPTKAVALLNKIAPDAVKALDLNDIDSLVDYRTDHPISYVQLFGALLLVHNAVDIDDIPDALLLKINESHSEDVQSVGVSLLAKYSDEQLLKKYDLILGYALSEKAAMRAAIRPIISRLVAGTTPDSDEKSAYQYDNSRYKSQIYGEQADEESRDAFAQRLLNDLIPPFFKSEPHAGLHDDLYDIIETDLLPWLAVIDAGLRWRLLHAQSKAAQKLGALALAQLDPIKADDSHIYTVKQWAKLADNNTLAVRQWSHNAYTQHIDHIKAHADDALRLLNVRWEDSRTFGIDYFREHFGEKEWHSDLIVHICDSTYDNVQRFGRELLTTYFKESDGVNYLSKLSQHPSQNVQLFTTNYLADYATGDMARLQQLKGYFITVLSQVYQGRVAKDRIVNFLNHEALQSKDAAQLVTDIYRRQSVTLSILDKANYIEGMHAIQQAYPDIATPIAVQPLAIKGKGGKLVNSNDISTTSTSTTAIPTTTDKQEAHA